MLTAIAASVVVASPVAVSHTTVELHAQVEDLLVQLICDDEILAKTPFVDPEDPHSVNPRWSDRAYFLVDQTAPGLGLALVDWYTAEEAAANREGRSPRLPWQRPTRYSTFVVHNNGQLDAVVD
jgi:hypothetical protein